MPSHTVLYREEFVKQCKARTGVICRFMNQGSVAPMLAMISLLLSVTPALFAQRDVHATLIAAAERRPAPPFRLISETGEAKRLSDYRGKVVLLNLWATDCGGCVLEIPSIIDIQARFKGDGFTVVGLSMDIPYENLEDAKHAWAKVKPFIARSKINYPILMGGDSQFKEFGLTQLPDTLLIDKTGKIATTYVGIINKDDVEANITKLLSE